MAKTRDELYTLAGLEKAPIDEAKTIIATSLVANHVKPLLENQLLHPDPATHFLLWE